MDEIGTYFRPKSTQKQTTRPLKENILRAQGVPLPIFAAYSTVFPSLHASAINPREVGTFQPSIIMAPPSSTTMDYSLDTLLNGIAVNPHKPAEIVLGHGEALWLLSHNFTSQKLTLERSIQLGSFGVTVGYTSGGDGIAAATGSGEVRLFDAELNLKRRYAFDANDPSSALGRPTHKSSGGHLGIDLLIGFDSGKVFAYDSRSNAKTPAIKIENHSNTINSIQCLDWWNFVSVGDDAYVTMHDFRSKKCRQEYGPMEGLPRNICICPISKKTLICSLHCIYVFETYKYDEGPILRANPPYKGRMPVSAVNLSTEDNPGIFGVGYLDSPYVTVLDTDENKWIRRYPTLYPNIDHFTHADKNAEYVYFIGEETNLCVRPIDDLRNNFDMELDVKAGKRSSGKQEVEKKALNFSGLVSDDDNDDENDDDVEMGEDNDDDVDMAEDGADTDWSKVGSTDFEDELIKLRRKANAHSSDDDEEFVNVDGDDEEEEVIEMDSDENIDY
uniref:WD_REPEATS_REGION domain-containing protein n=1 Tax=Panagrellus redivivus TaxID=6233 RepID=A0A7E4UZR5_PANRE